MTATATARTASAPHSMRAEAAIRRLCGLARLSEREIGLIRQAGSRMETHLQGVEIRGGEELAGRPRIIASGWAARTRALADGRRQIVSLLLPGDPLDLRRSMDPLAACGVVALTRVETFDIGGICDLIAADEPWTRMLARALAIAERQEQMLIVEHLVRLGRRSAYERTAHLMLELYNRLTAAGLTSHNRFLLPLSQEVLADTLGLSIVHVNRTLQQMKRDRLLEIRKGMTVLTDPATLATVADYRSPWPEAKPTAEPQPAQVARRS